MATLSAGAYALNGNGNVTTMAEPRRGEELLCQWVQGLFMDAVAGRNVQITAAQWREWERGYWGSYWPDALPSYKSPIQINEIKKLLLTELSDLTDNSPTIYVTSDPQKGTRAQEVEKAIQAYWQRSFLDLTILEACLDASIWPCGFLEVFWDQTLAQGQGDIVVRNRPPQTVFPDPYAIDDETWRYVITQDVMDLNEVRQKWPDQGRRVRPDAARPADPHPFIAPSDRPSGVGLVTPLYPISAPVPTQGMDTRVTIYSVRVKDATLEVVPGQYKDADGITHLQRSFRYKYPMGRLIQCTSDVVLFDDKMPYGDGFDLIRLLLQPSVHRFWPDKSLLGDLLELQRASDKLESLTVENALRLQKGMVIADANSGIDPRTFGDIPGQVILKTPGSEVKMERPPPLPGDLIQQGARLRGEMRQLMGHQPSRSGQQGRGNVSAELTETEISQAMGLTRLRGRFLHKGTHRLASKILARMGEFYTHPRFMPYVQNEMWSPIQWTPIVDKWQDYAAYIDPNSFSVQSKTLVKRLAMTLARIGRMASDEDLYKVLEFPDGKGIAKRNMQQLELAAQANQKQKASGSGRKR